MKPFIRTLPLLLLCLAILPEAARALEVDPFAEQKPLLSREKSSTPGKKEEQPSQPEGPPIEPESVSLEKPDTLWDFFAKRTQIGYGFESLYNDNITLRDNHRQEDLIGTLDSVVLFTDPRGSFLYGSQYEVNAFRYMYLNRNAINHDLVAFADFDPGGRYSLRANYYLSVRNALTLGNPGLDVFITSSDFQRSAEHKGEAQLKYLLNETFSLASNISYSVFDLQKTIDSSIDRHTLETTLDLSREMNPVWAVFVGGGYRNLSVPGDKLKNTNSFTGRLGTQYNAGPNEKLSAIFELEFPRIKKQERSTDLNFSGGWTHLLNPRTILKLGYVDTRRTSFVSGRTEFRSKVPSGAISYQLTPLITLDFSGQLERQRSDKSAVTGGTAPSSVSHRLYACKAAVAWQVREQARILLAYSHKRSTTRDFTERTVYLDFEAAF